MFQRNFLALVLLQFASAILSTSTVGVAQDKSPSFGKLEFRKWSGDINVPDPVALSVDNFGRVFVTQTQRRKVQDLDIRQHREWVTNDLSFKTVEDKRNFFKKVLAIGGDEAVQSAHVEDWNEDGVHDWRDLTVISEKIYRVVDTDRDGTADEISVFAEDFRTEVTGVAAGVMAYDGEVYATVAPDVWKLRDQDEDGQADSREVIAHGFGLHIAYGGHDMHGLIVGPDGKIYWSIGDKGISVRTPDGREFRYPHRGGVMRCNPDGSDFEVFAHGLRNVQEVGFDQYGNMFGVDNDADQPNEKERFVYIVNGMDAGWRNYYQYRGNAYNPWTAERLWDLPGENHPAYIVPPISHYVDGPAGFKFNPGTALSSEYRDFFFLTSAPNGKQFAFSVAPRGDAFEMQNAHQIGEGLAIVGLAFGPDGALYGADWDGGYPLDQKGAVIRIDAANEDQTDLRAEVQKRLEVGFRDLDKSELVAMLSHPDMRLRQGAQFALVDLEATDLLSQVALKEDGNELARLHALWGLGQRARAGEILGRDILGLLTRDDNAHVRGQAAKTYAELQEVDAAPLLPLLGDDDLHVRTLAAIGLSRQPTSKAVERLFEQCDKIEPNQHYLRFAFSSALSKCATEEQLAEQSKHDNVARRMCCVLALRKQGNGGVANFLDDKSQWVADEAARALHDESIVDGHLLPLAAALLSRASPSEAFFRRALNANFRLGDRASFGRVVEFVSKTSADAARCAVALESLGDWLDVDKLDRVEGIYRPLQEDGRAVDVERFGLAIDALVGSTDDAVRNAALAAAKKLGLQLSLDTLQAMVANEDLDDESRIMALDGLRDAFIRTLATAKTSESEALRIRVLEISAIEQQDDAIAEIKRLLKSDESPSTKQAAVRMLGKLSNQATLDLLGGLTNEYMAGSLESSLELDLVAALTTSKATQPEAGELLAKIESSDVAENRVAGKFRFSRDGGDVEAGALLFQTHGEAQCVRCHRVGSEGSEIGPPLTAIGKLRDANYLLRAIAYPSADIDEKYRSQLLLLDSDEVVKGVIQSQTDELTVVADSSGKLIEIPTGEIVDTAEQKVSLMPEMTEILTPSEVRDLIAYLRSLTEEPTAQTP